MSLDDIKVRFRGGHPHAGEIGTPTGKVIRTPTGTEMWEFTLHNCEHGTEACYANKADIVIVEKDGRAVYLEHHGVPQGAVR